MEYSIKPEEHELREAKKVVQGVLAGCKTVLEKEEDLQIQIGWDRDIYSCAEENKLYIEFNTENEEWKKKLKTATAYGYAHSLFDELSPAEQRFNWQRSLRNGFGLIFLDKVLPEIAEEKTGETDSYKISDWTETKELMNQEIGEKEIPWQLNYLIGRKLQQKHELKEIPELKRSDVIEAGEEQFQ
ncbi:MAG: hypothetical protein ABEJ95_04700 [Candidatus Nanohalobium sp.]